MTRTGGCSDPEPGGGLQGPGAGAGGGRGELSPLLPLRHARHRHTPGDTLGTGHWRSKYLKYISPKSWNTADANCAVVWRDDVQPLDAGVRLARPRDAAQARVQGRRAARPPQVSLPPRQVAI